MDGQQQIIHHNHKQGGFENCLAFWTNRPLRGQALDETNKQYSFKAYLEIILKALVNTLNGHIKNRKEQAIDKILIATG